MFGINIINNCIVKFQTIILLRHQHYLLLLILLLHFHLPLARFLLSLHFLELSLLRK
jgi:hypothetical protein